MVCFVNGGKCYWRTESGTYTFSVIGVHPNSASVATVDFGDLTFGLDGYAETGDVKVQLIAQYGHYFCTVDECGGYAGWVSDQAIVTPKGGNFVFRVGRNYSRTCPACPSSDPNCLNPMEETIQFNIGERVYAVCQTLCKGTTPVTPFNWYKKNASGNYELITSWTPSQGYGTAVESYLDNGTEGCWKVEYSEFSKLFNIGRCGGTGNNTINYKGFGKYVGNNCTEFSSCSVPISEVSGQNLKLMYQVTINSPGNYRVHFGITVNGAGYGIDTGDINFNTGTYWKCISVGNMQYEPATYVITEAWFL